MDKTTETIYETSLTSEEESADVVHLTHLTTPESIYHLRLGFASLASRPHTPKWYHFLMWPFTLWSVLLTWLYGRTFISERNTFKGLNLQSWIIPRFNVHVRFFISISFWVIYALIDIFKKFILISIFMIIKKNYSFFLLS